jgi:hypothetical protein
MTILLTDTFSADVSKLKDIVEWLGGVHAGTNTSQKAFVTLNEKTIELRPSPPKNQTTASQPSKN